MIAKSVSKVLLTTHPGYGMRLGIAGTEQGHDVLATELHMVPGYDDEYERFSIANGLTDDENWFDHNCVSDWIRTAWIAADGPSSGRHVVLLENGMDDEIDLTTGKEPDPVLGFFDIG